jgi:hypothetical protein
MSFIFPKWDSYQPSFAGNPKAYWERAWRYLNRAKPTCTKGTLSTTAEETPAAFRNREILVSDPVGVMSVMFPENHGQDFLGELWDI